MELNAKCFPFASSSPLRIHAGHHIDVLRHIVQVIVMRHPNPRTHLSLSEVQKSEYNPATQWMSVDSKRNIYSSLSPVWKILMTNIFAMMTICHYLQIEKTTMLHATPPMRCVCRHRSLLTTIVSDSKDTHNQQQTECVIDAKGQQNGKMEHYPQTPRTKLNIAQYSSDKVRVALVHFWEFA